MADLIPEILLILEVAALAAMIAVVVVEKKSKRGAKPYNMQAAPSLMALVENMVQTGQRVGGTAEMEVKVTPEMIEAGLDALVYMNEDLYSRERAVKEIYLAMVDQSPTRSRNQI